MTHDKPDGPCVNCKTRPATSWWTADGGVLAWTHGMAAAWCELCCVEAQIEHAETVAARLPEMRARAALLKEST